MSKTIFQLAVPLGQRRPYLSGQEALVNRVRMVLETRPGQLPWRPDFGCDLSSLLGLPATTYQISQAQFLVEQALSRWVPEVRVKQCSVEMKPKGTGAGYQDYGAPIAEAYLLSDGTRAALQINLELESEAGPLSLQTVVDT